jgi:hypothetical protein
MTALMLKPKLMPPNMATIFLQDILEPCHIQASNLHQARSIQVSATRLLIEVEILVANSIIYPPACIHRWFKVEVTLTVLHLVHR